MSGSPEITPSDFGRLFAALRHCVLVHDAETKAILWANPAACAVLGFTVDELKPLKAPDMSSNARQYAREIGVTWLQRAVDEGTSTIEWCYRSKTGVDILTEAVAVRVDLAAGPVVMVQFRDIAEEKATRRDLFRTEGRLHTFLRNLDEGIVVLDGDGRTLFASATAAALLGGEPDDLLGIDFAGFLAPESAALLREALTTSSQGLSPGTPATASPPRAARTGRPAGSPPAASTSTSSTTSVACFSSSTTSPTPSARRTNTATTPNTSTTWPATTPWATWRWPSPTR
ncbi:PAS domain-containing protein [Streptomyces sp. FXJ1.4098]|nr:PAS domain-containing protein [Streptomyces sp. FXJ1.4098]